MSVSPETAPDDVDPTLPTDTPQPGSFPVEASPADAGGDASRSDEGQTDIETGEPARGTDPIR